MGNRKWCRRKKTYRDWSGRRELAPEFEDTVEEELSFLKSMASISEEQAEEMLATFPEEDIAEVKAMQAQRDEEALADEPSIQTHPELTEEEIEEHLEDLVKAVEPLFTGKSFEVAKESEAELSEETEAELKELLAELMQRQE